MFIFLSKFLPLFIYPPGLASIFILAALFFWKKRRFSKVLLIGAFIVLFIGGNRYLANSMARSLEWQYPNLGPVQSIDAIVVLGGATEPGIAPRPMTEMNAAGDRVLYAVKLYQDHPEAKLILSGGDIEFLDQSDATPAGDMASIMNLMGVPDSAMILQDRSQNTYEDALYSCEKIKAAGFENVVLVTSALHMPRSVKLFTKQGCTVIPAPTDYTITEVAWQKTWHPSFQEFLINLVPSYSNMSQIAKSMKEYIGMFAYRLKGWL